jgi:LmbE family N-acetylglucosaminyl deacetylase
MKNILVVAPHPDDEILGCGGTIARHVKHGDRVHLVVVTRGMPEVFSPDSVVRVRRELSAAQQLLGISSVKFLDFPAPSLDTVPGYLLSSAILSVLREVQPDIVYFPHHGDIHGDHRAASLATMVAARPNGNTHVPRLLTYETLSESEWGNPNSSDAFLPTVFVDISEYLQDKLKAMQCYESQLRSSPNARSLEAIRALATYRGHSVNLPAAEAFMLVREIVC